MSGRFIFRSDRTPRHYCNPPTVDGTGIDPDGQPGDIWRCSCGRDWIISRKFKWRRRRLGLGT